MNVAHDTAKLLWKHAYGAARRMYWDHLPTHQTEIADTIATRMTMAGWDSRTAAKTEQALCITMFWRFYDRSRFQPFRNWSTASVRHVGFKLDMNGSETWIENPRLPA